MLIACWSVKGGSGTTVVAAGLALVLARRHPGGVLLADLAGDLPHAVGAASPAAPGIADWIDAGPSIPIDALRKLEIEIGRGVRLLPLGDSGQPLPPESAPRLLLALREGAPEGVDGVTPVVLDAGRPDAGSLAAALVDHASTSLLVLRPCYLALRRAVAAAHRPTGVVLVHEKSRALSPLDVEDALGVPVVALVPDRPEIARAVDAGMLAGRLPRTLASALKWAA